MIVKKRIWLIVPIILFVTLTSLYLVYDGKGYEYGLGCNFCNKKLPYNLKPHDGTQFSFTLKDEADFELVGIGFKYSKSSFKIRDFLAYGYNDTSIIAKVTDSLNNVKYLVSYETGYKSKKGNSEISFKDLSNSDFEQIKNKYQWVEIDEERANAIQFMKSLFLVGIFLSLFILIRQFFKRNSKATH